MHHVQMPLLDLFQPQGQARHRSHESGVHHDAVLQIDDEFTKAALHHFTAELFKAPAVQKTAPTLHSHPDDWPVYPNLNRRFHYEKSIILAKRQVKYLLP